MLKSNLGRKLTLFKLTRQDFLRPSNSYNHRWNHHIVLLLNGVRNAIRHSLPLEYKITERTDNGHWQGRAIIPAEYLPPNVTKLNAYAIHGSGSNRTYESLYPVPQGHFENPDL